MNTSMAPVVPRSSQPSFPVRIAGSEVAGGGDDFGDRVMEGQKVFHFLQFEVSLISERQVEGGAEICVRAKTAKEPPGP
jgi:hypothetical protein